MINLKFWKRKERVEPGLERTPLPSGESPAFGEFEMPATTRSPEYDIKPSSPFEMQQPSYAAPRQDMTKDVEIISAKIDALKAMLESISQRIANIERIAQSEQEKAKRSW